MIIDGNVNLKSFLYEIIGLAIIIMVSLVLFVISKLAGFIALSGAILYGIVLFVVYSTYPPNKPYQNWNQLLIALNYD